MHCYRPRHPPSSHVHVYALQTGRIPATDAQDAPILVDPRAESSIAADATYQYLHARMLIAAINRFPRTRTVACSTCLPEQIANQLVVPRSQVHHEINVCSLTR